MDLRQAADVGAREAREQLLGDRQAEDAVAEEREPAPGVDPALGPGAVGEGLKPRARLELRDQCQQRCDRLPLAAASSSSARLRPPQAPANALEDEIDRGADGLDLAASSSLIGTP